MINYIKISNYYEELASSSFSKEGIIIGVVAAIFVLILLILVATLMLKFGDPPFEIFLTVMLSTVFLPIIVFFSLATKIKSDKDLEKPKYLSKVKKYNINSLKNLKDNIELLREEMKFGTSNSDEEINKILNEFYNPESRNKNNNNELIKKLKN